VLALIGLDGDRETRIGQLSGGQQRRVDLGLGIVGRPELLFLDEPTTGLDPAARRSAWAIVRRLAAEGTAVLFSTHYMEEAQQLADRLLVLADGRLVADATPGVLRARPTPTKAKPDPAGGVCICCRSPSALERDGPLSGARRPPSPTRRGSAEDRPRSSRRRCR
jgi:ABC-2 type transport system ATP-binding protein